MWKELITELSNEHPFIKINPPAAMEEIIEAETKLNIKFPEELKECLLELNGDGDALLSIPLIIEINLLMREIYGKDTLLRVATNGCGDDFGYKLEAGQVIGTDIYMWNHEVDELILVAFDLKDAVVRHYNDGI